ncbi:MAG: VWA domain-containing protein [Polyangiales bacterium]|nr:VWA domain-containing protein [Myxococcales bacterium]MCB9656633.1 VWA domain-containing protein [Sandaracinaceae bacterium]
MEERLADVRRRLERLHSAPDRAPSGFERVLVPVLRAVGWRPQLSTDAARALLDAARARLSAPERPSTLPAATPQAGGTRTPLPPALLEATLAELEDNLRAVERSALVHQLAPGHYLAWLTRVHDWLRDMGRAQTLDVAHAWRVAGAARTSRVTLPLTVSAADAPPGLPLGTVDVLMEAARDEVGSLHRRRRLLEGARRVLLELGASATLEPEPLAARREDLLTGITELNRLEAAGLDGEVQLPYQLRQARARRDAPKTYLALAAVEAFARERGDVELALHAGRCLARIPGASGPSGSSDPPAGPPTHARVSTEAPLPGPVARALREAYAQERARAAEAAQAATMSDARELRRREAYFSEEGALRAALLGLVADGCFDVGGSLSPVRVTEDLRTRITVQHPTAALVLETAGSPADLASAVIDDPRLLLYQLAGGRLLCRRYADERVQRRERDALVSQARIYVLDGSSSMVGARARMRDALLVSELGALVARLMAPETYVHTVLYFRFFDHAAAPTQRIATVDEAVAAVRVILARERGGRTDIEGALVDSFAQVTAARAHDPHLTHAQVVLVTDGEADVSAERVLAARAALSDLPIGVSVVALGDENRDLRALADEQRRAGEAVFYHHLSDAELERWERGEVDLGVPLRTDDGVRDGAWLELLADELSATEQAADPTRTVDELDHAGVALSALDDVGLTAASGRADGERARWEAARRDHAALERRFARWFPDIAEAEASTLTPADGPDAHALLALVDALSVVSEMLALLGSGGAGAMVDAIDLLGRLLWDAGISPARYGALLRDHPGPLREPLRAVRAAAGQDGRRPAEHG